MLSPREIMGPTFFFFFFGEGDADEKEHEKVGIFFGQRWQRSTF